MVKFNYTNIVKVADKLIDQFGTTGQLKRGTVLRPCTLVRVDYTAQERDGQLIQFNDTRFLVASGDIETPPSAEDDRLVVEGQEKRIMSSRPLRPATTTLLYDLQVRL